MDYILKKVSYEDTDKIIEILRYAQDRDNEYANYKINRDGIERIRWFEKRFFEPGREVYLILNNSYDLMGFVMVNSNTKVTKNGHRLSELLILPQYRNNYLGLRVCQKVFDMHAGNWEVEPIFGDLRSYYFFRRAILQYTKKYVEFVQRTFVFRKELKRSY